MNDRQFSFAAIDEIAPGIKFRTIVNGYCDGESSMTIRSLGQMLDYRVTSFTSYAENRDTSGVRFLDFDVYAAYFARIEEQRPADPILDLRSNDAQLEVLLESYNALFAKIWAGFGGCCRGGFEELSLWMLKKDIDAGQNIDGLGGAFAAYLFGNRLRALELLEDMESNWKERINRGGGASLAEAYRATREVIDRARVIIV